MGVRHGDWDSAPQGDAFECLSEELEDLASQWKDASREEKEEMVGRVSRAGLSMDGEDMYGFYSFCRGSW